MKEIGRAATDAAGGNLRRHTYLLIIADVCGLTTTTHIYIYCGGSDNGMCRAEPQLCFSTEEQSDMNLPPVGARHQPFIHQNNNHNNNISLVRHLQCFATLYGGARNAGHHR